MTVQRCDLMKDGRGGSLNEDLVREWSCVYQVITDNRADGMLTVMNAPGLPGMYDFYAQGAEADNGVWVVGIVPKQNKEIPTMWEVEIKYSNRMPDPTRRDENPLLIPARISWTYTRYQGPIIADDQNGRAVLNSALQAFDPPPEIDFDRPMLRIVRNEPSFNFATSLKFRQALNKKAFFGAPALCWKCAGITAERQFGGGFLYWVVTYEFEHKPDTWVIKILDQGKSELQADGSLKQIKDKFGVAVPNPVTLNGAGKRLSSAQTTLAGVGGAAPIDAGALNFDVADATVFGPTPFVLTIDNEDMKVTGVNGNTLTVVRAQSNTTAAGHAIGKKVRQAPVFITLHSYPEEDYGDLKLL